MSLSISGSLAIASSLRVRSSAGMGTEPCTGTHDGYTLIALLPYVTRNALGENSGLTEVRTIPVVLLARRDTQGFILFAVCAALGGLGTLLFAMTAWKKMRWTRIVSTE